MAWTENYRSRIGTPEEAMGLIKSRDSVYLHAGAATPQLFVDAFSKRVMELEGVTVSHILSLGDAKYVTPEMEGHVRLNSLFTGTNVREAVNAGRADWTPIFLSEIPGLFKNGHIPVDVALIHVSPPDSHGFCSFGVSTDTTIAACKVAKIIVAMVNRQMPRVHGDNFIHASKLDFIVEANEPLFQAAKVELSERHMLIGKYIASLIEDGSTLQMGIGAIPDATLFYLKEKRNLGIHTEMFSDGVVELVESGVINGEEKSLHPGKVVSSIVMGSQHVYDFIHENPFMEFHPTDYVNDPYIIAQNNKMVAINSSIEIDLTGQVCSDSMGRTNFSGIGGQVDFMRGASRSIGGRPIIAMPSTAKQGTQSRIVLDLKPGAAVTTSRGDVHYIVTEFGIAHLHGKTLRERAKALIEIAHPDFREELERQSFESKLLH
ncbi:MAG: acetyl-CoA hydrolase/transferase family protein [Candidatus Marinimicrobia bacterium]|jgi:4-hydroxybutyrate CoA-transferase|nr:acetyl-CoA hydrolase/transferase family protein [Candidatus Neomarinimicrobiota bacterium]MBT4360723.1 acetyl-CoA hydrolase/transferase family protein [Candidatus Neomarinimicrobiota bacterium]MBT4714895.1 acetyl-CoA hydrolase/transferase family protein [Candidatus Neomarinimicrobiota bacterium]MBT4945406.1 acetyl-CoA hydrolase/transferase family protein [Candidatus Neomarinimicrobiota bacterium]MBT5269995.1 acetyl-CoA hydrolase/transferase family protein [Candidatus Neomarinimicrobiota bact